MSDLLKVRPVCVADFNQWLELWTGYNHFYDRVLPSEITESTWSRFFDPDEPVHALVAEKQDQLVGLAHFIYHRNTTTIEPVCYLSDLFTKKTARGLGVGRLLIENVCESAASAGLTRVYWQTQETNSTAMKLYDKVADRSGFLVYRKQL